MHLAIIRQVEIIVQMKLTFELVIATLGLLEMYFNSERILKTFIAKFQSVLDPLSLLNTCQLTKWCST